MQSGRKTEKINERDKKEWAIGERVAEGFHKRVGHTLGTYMTDMNISKQ
jgi:hypothetical protein